jgi:hypothetical protein
MNRTLSGTWKRYSFEFLSIFIAVSSAFALNNWNDSRKSREAESKILTEIYNGLGKDLEDLQLNQLGHRMGIRSCNYFKDILTEKPVPADSFLYHYFHLTRDFISIQNTSGYETLKARGFELIDNDSLRTRIISLYEYDYTTLRKFEEEYHEMQFQENYFNEINLFIAPDMEFDSNNNFSGLRTPLKLETDEKKLLLTYLWKIRANRYFVLQYYAEVEQKVDSLRAQIARELE